MRVGTLVVGAGYTGAVLAERIATGLNEPVLVIDRRGHVGGNAYDYYDDAGILVHRYGAHIFHTKSERVWEYLSKFTDWHPYEHRVLAEVDGSMVPLPFNFRSIEMLLAKSTAEHLKEKLTDEYGRDAKVPILKLRQTQDGELRRLAEFIYEKVFVGYTRKQWELSPEDLGPSVTARVPVVVGYDDRYFDDPHQGTPLNGYTAVFNAILDHPKIEIRLNTEFSEVKDEVEYSRLIFTGPIDEFFDYTFGPLPYRSLRFEWTSLNYRKYQEVAVVNYPNRGAFTRIIEFKHMTGQESGRTSIAREFPEAHEPDSNEPYYPIPMRENRDLYNMYARRAKSLDQSAYFAGRLADYKYYNMDQAVARALSLADIITRDESGRSR